MKEEAQIGCDRNTLVPALLESVEIPFGFQSIQAAALVDWTMDWEDRHLVGLLDAVRSKMLKVAPAKSPSAVRLRILNVIASARVRQSLDGLVEELPYDAGEIRGYLAIFRTDGLVEYLNTQRGPRITITDAGRQVLSDGGFT